MVFTFTWLGISDRYMHSKTLNLNSKNKSSVFRLHFL